MLDQWLRDWKYDKNVDIQSRLSQMEVFVGTTTHRLNRG